MGLMELGSRVEDCWRAFVTSGLQVSANSVYRPGAELQDLRDEALQGLSDSALPKLADHRFRTDSRGHDDQP